MRVQLPLGAFLFAWTVRRENDCPSAVNDYQRVGQHGPVRHKWAACLGQATEAAERLARMKAEAAVVEHRSKAGVPKNRDCGLESHGFRLENNTCPWPSGRGASLPSWTGGFDSRRALLIGSVAQRQSRCLLSTHAWVRVPPFPLSLRGSRCWQRCWALTPEAQVRFLPPQFANFLTESVSFDAQLLRDSRCW